PAILWLFEQNEDLVSAEQRHTALGAIESWLVRRTVCRLTTKDYNRLFLDLLGRLASDSEDVGTTTTDFLASQTAAARLWPSDEQVVDACRSVPMYSVLTRSRLRMILEAIEDSLRSPKTEDEFVTRGRLTIEHILPQSWGTHWPATAREG